MLQVNDAHYTRPAVAPAAEYLFKALMGAIYRELSLTPEQVQKAKIQRRIIARKR